MPLNDALHVLAAGAWMGALPPLLFILSNIGKAPFDADAATALRIGLVEEVVEKGAAREFALQMAARVAGLSPQAVTFSKDLIQQARNGVPRTAALAVERERFVDLFDGADQREGVNAFLEKRAPQWQGVQSKESQR